ncbi:MAG: aspartate aminotransferase family protein [Bacteroidales bacterium]
MNTNRQLFLSHLGQTSPQPLLKEISHAEGIYLYAPDGKQYIDLVSGVSVSNLGHNNPYIVEKVCEQTQKFMHLLVYGELIQEPQVQFAKALIEVLDVPFEMVYFVNSGSEAVEGAIKLAKRYTHRHEVIAFKHSYHGSTQGAMSVMGGEYYKEAFRPLIPGTTFLDFNNFRQIETISTKHACVIVEPIQGEAGIILPEPHFLNALREQCNKTGTLLIFDEIQTGFGRTGKMFAFQKYGVVPDIICLAKALGGGMPLGAFISNRAIMQTLTHSPILGHITTFGGHPVCCAAGMASLSYIRNNDYLLTSIPHKETLFRQNLIHRRIKNIRGTGLFLAVELENQEILYKTIYSLCENGIITDPFLFCPTHFRIAPPLIITSEQIIEACEKIIEVLNEL